MNFPWWQDEHAFYIDLRVALPMRWASLEIGRKLGADRPDDTMFLFWPELLDVAEGRTSWASSAGWSASAGTTSSSGTPDAPPCRRCWAPSPTRSPTRS